MKYLRFFNILILSIVLFPFIIAHAATLEIENKDTDVQQGDLIVLDVYINSLDEINSIEGSILLSGDYGIKTITTAGSVFDMWPNKPSYQNGEISFVGGSASSVFGNRLKIFSIVLEIQSQEGVTFMSKDINVFLNNGIGTKISVEPFEKNIALVESDGNTKNKFDEIIRTDVEPPVSFEVVIGRDDTVYDGKYFATFNTTDKDSGIERYEVFENDNKTPVVTGTTYVLQDQTLKGTLIVKAIDKAGNIQTVQINTEDFALENKEINWPSLLIALFVLYLVFLLSKKIKINYVKE